MLLTTTSGQTITNILLTRTSRQTITNILLTRTSRQTITRVDKEVLLIFTHKKLLICFTTTMHQLTTLPEGELFDYIHSIRILLFSLCCILQ